MKHIQCIEHELTRIIRHLDTLTRNHHYPMDRAHYVLLSALEHKTNMPIGDLAQELLLDKSTVTRQVEAMENKKLVERSRSKQDGRNVFVSATEYGKTQIQQMRDLRIALTESMLNSWTEDDLAQLQTLLTQLNTDIKKQVQCTDANQ